GIGTPIPRTITFQAGVKSVDVYGGSTTTFTLGLSAPTTPVTLHGGPGGKTLGSGAFINNWAITANKARTLQGTVPFQNIQNLRGGVLAFASDTFVFSDQAGVAGSILGGSNPSSIATLNYSNYTTPVTVNLKTNVATGVGLGVFHVEDVIGGQG